MVASPLNRGFQPLDQAENRLPTQLSIARPDPQLLHFLPYKALQLPIHVFIGEFNGYYNSFLRPIAERTETSSSFLHQTHAMGKFSANGNCIYRRNFNLTSDEFESFRFRYSFPARVYSKSWKFFDIDIKNLWQFNRLIFNCCCCLALNSRLNFNPLAVGKRWFAKPSLISHSLRFDILTKFRFSSPYKLFLCTNDFYIFKRTYKTTSKHLKWFNV